MGASLLYAKSIPINEHISICVPSVGEVLDDKDNYFEIISTIISTPYDMMVQLDDAKIDFTKINDFELFCLLVGGIQKRDASLVFGETDISKLVPAVNRESGEMILVDLDRGVTIDREIHAKIAAAVRRMLFIEKNEKKPGNDEAKRYMIERARKKQKRRKRDGDEDATQLENIIVALVNAEEFAYNYETVRDISIYQLYCSLHQISHTIKFDNTMIGYYTGNVKLEDLKPEDRTWLRSRLL